MAQTDVPMADIVDRSHTATPPITFSSPKAVAMARVPSQTMEEPTGKLNIAEVHRKAAKKRKKKKTNNAPAPATNTVRGFETPRASGAEDSDYSLVGTPRLGPSSTGFSSLAGSPSLRPQTGASGISQLKLQLESLDLERTRSKEDIRRPRNFQSNTMSSADSVVSSGSDSPRTVMESYEVPLEEDFVSPEVGEKGFSSLDEGVNGFPTLTRKMASSDFDALNCLGKGTYGTVLLVKQRETGRLYAQKQLRKASLTVHKKLIEQTKTERSILESVNRHPFVVKLYYAFQDHEKLYLILEYAQGGELFHHLNSIRMFDEETAAFYMAEMVLALEHLQCNIGVVYRDLKPENCLLDAEGHLLLTDFGLSKVAVEGEDCKSMLGTIEYMAPEVIQGLPYGMAVDWWSLGALGYDLLTGAPPFTANNTTKTMDKIVKGKVALPYYLSPDAKDLITRLLRKDPKKRLGANISKDIKIIKTHRFFRKLDWRMLERKEIDPPIKPVITDPELAENFSADFTDLALSPTRDDIDPYVAMESNPFGGFSFVASQSLLESGFLA